ncbi:MAG: hypothetical protein COA78_21890 [Blastopirellula sp.]|nr:MAG: hypothetical protein COA78_21890 [Blastopirellula sp.]
MEALIKTMIENPEKISLIVVLFMFGVFAVWLLVKMQTSREKLHNDNAKNLMILNEKTIGGIDKLAIAIEKQAASSIELSTLIKFGLKDK